MLQQLKVLGINFSDLGYPRGIRINRGDLTEVNKVWFYLINSMFRPSKHVSIVRQDYALLLYELVKGFELDVGRIIKESILDYTEKNFSSNIPHPSLITLMCIKGGVKFNEDEEQSPKASPLTLIGLLKSPVEGEEEKRIRKRKMVETKQPREPVLTVEDEDELEHEERGGLEDYIE